MVRALLAMGCEARATTLARDECEKVMAQPAGLCVIDADADEHAVRWLVDALAERHPSCQIVLVLSNIAREYVFELIHDRRISNVVAKRPGPGEIVRSIDEKELVATCSKLVSENFFGLEQYLPVRHLDIREQRITGSADRYHALDVLAEYLQNLYCTERMISLISTATDELLMNAMFCAPTDAAGNHKYDVVDRASPLSLLAEEHVTLRYACDGHNVLVSVADNFGSLARQTLIEHLHNGWLGQQKAVRWDTSGAGLGLHLVFTSAAQLIVNVESGVRTEFIMTFYVREGLRRLGEMGHSLNLFYR